VYLATTVTRESPHGITTNIVTGRHIQAGGSLLKSIVYQMSCICFVKFTATIN